MAIEKYTTEAIVIEHFDQGEHDRVYKLFTKDFGLVMAHAKSVRKLESKLRAHLLPRTVSVVTLVQGRDVWRLVGAQERAQYGRTAEEVVHLVRRLIRGEGAHKALYGRLTEYLSVESTLDPQKSKLLLYYFMLVELGYADAKAIGARDIREYISWNMTDLYTHLLLTYEGVRSHVYAVLKEIQL
jgi:recombinational DNA repair protein (RecF pathway)